MKSRFTNSVFLSKDASHHAILRVMRRVDMRDDSVFFPGMKIQNIGVFLLYITEILEFTCALDGGQFESNIYDLKVQIQNRSIVSNTIFKIRQIESISLNYPFDVKPFSPVFEFTPHSVQFNKPIKIFYKRNTPLNENICLFKQDINHFSNGTNIWSISFPKKNESNMLEFELNSFSIIFFANCEYCKYEKFQKKYEQYQIIKPGLNYRISCLNENCADKLIIKTIGFNSITSKKNFLPQSDSFKCSKCDEGIVINTNEFYKVIKTIILFECVSSINLNGSIISLKANGGELTLINFNKDDFNASICINTNNNDSGKRLIAGIDPEQFNDKEKANNRDDQYFGDQERKISGYIASMLYFIMHSLIFVLLINLTYLKP